MYSDYSILVQFDILLAKNQKEVFYTSDINELLSRITSKYLDRKYCLNWFIDNDILINVGEEYYYTGEKIERYKPYKGYQKIVKIVKEKEGLPIDFDLINFTLD